MAFSDIIYKIIDIISYHICCAFFVVFCLELLFVDLLMLLLFTHACIYEPQLLMSDLSLAVASIIGCNWLLYQAYMGRLE